MGKVRYKQLKVKDGYFVGTDGSLWTTMVKTRPLGQTGFLWLPGGPWKRMSPCKNKYGYLYVILRPNGVQRQFLVHHLVLDTFRGPRPPRHEAAHGNGIRDDNRLDNLSWKTPKGNSDDKKRHGTHPSGEVNGNSLLTPEDVVRIDTMISDGNSCRSISEIFGVSTSAIQHIRTGKNWNQITRRIERNNENAKTQH